MKLVKHLTGAGALNASTKVVRLLKTKRPEVFLFTKKKKEFVIANEKKNIGCFLVGRGKAGGEQKEQETGRRGTK